MAIASSAIKIYALGSVSHGKPGWLDSLMVAFAHSLLTGNGDDI